MSLAIDDSVLVERARNGSRDAAGELFERHWPRAWRLAAAVTGRRDMADDIAQDAFERAFAALTRFDLRARSRLASPDRGQPCARPVAQ